jgi:hypothetical protein
MTTRRKMGKQGWLYARDALWGQYAEGHELDEADPDDLLCGLVDALTNLRHFAEQNKLDWDAAVASCEGTHFPAEMEFGLDEETS